MTGWDLFVICVVVLAVIVLLLARRQRFDASRIDILERKGYEVQNELAEIPDGDKRTPRPSKSTMCKTCWEEFRTDDPSRVLCDRCAK